MNVSQQHGLAAKKVDGILGWIRKSTDSRSRDVSLLFFPTLVRPQVELGPGLSSPVQNRHGHTGKSQQRDTKMMDGLQHLFYGKGKG